MEIPKNMKQDELFIGSLDIPNATYAVKRKFIGRWRIRSMSEWDHEYLEMIKKPELYVSSRGYGTICFGAFDGIVDAMKDEWRPDNVMQFSFLGFDEGDEVCGRGCAVIEDEVMRGRIAFHRGMVSNFEAEKATDNGEQGGGADR